MQPFLGVQSVGKIGMEPTSLLLIILVLLVLVVFRRDLIDLFASQRTLVANHKTDKPKQPHGDQTHVAVEMVNKTISMQLLLSPKKDIDPNDDFAVGYLIGYTDAVMQKLRIDNNSAIGFATLTLVCQNFFGENIGPKVTGKFFDNQLDLSGEFRAGMMIGAQDVFAWLGAEKKVTPTGLSRHNFDRYGGA